MNEFDFTLDTSKVEDAKDLEGDIEIDGESFHIEEFEPTVNEYRELVNGLYKSFYDEDVQGAIHRAIEEKREEMRLELEAEFQKKELAIKEDLKKDILKKISKRRLRPDENGISVQHTSPKRDVSKMTREERALAAKRAASGLIINLK